MEYRVKSKGISVKLVHAKNNILVIQGEDKIRTEAVKLEKRTRNKREILEIPGRNNKGLVTN